VTKSLDRKAAEDLVVQYRVERAARPMGKFTLLIFALAVIAAVASLFWTEISLRGHVRIGAEG
jgi:hypothetical protein